MNKKFIDLINHYDEIVKGVETTAKNKADNRAYGGKIRAAKKFNEILYIFTFVCGFTSFTGFLGYC